VFSREGGPVAPGKDFDPVLDESEVARGALRPGLDDRGLLRRLTGNILNP
jgi:hypothetical protein